MQLDLDCISLLEFDKLQFGFSFYKTRRNGVQERSLAHEASDTLWRRSQVVKIVIAQNMRPVLVDQDIEGMLYNLLHTMFFLYYAHNGVPQNIRGRS